MVTLHSPIPLIKYDGIFDLDRIHSLIKEFMQNEDFDFEEKTYKQGKGTFGEEYELEWIGTREETDYFKTGIIVKMHTWDCELVEVLEKGKKAIKMRGRLTIEVLGEVETDWQKKWNKGISKTIKKMYEYVAKREIEVKYNDRIYYMAYDLHRKIKDLLNTES